MVWAFAGFLFYLVVGHLTVNMYPFSAYSMYASVPKMNRSGVPTFFVNNREAVLCEYVDFIGINPKQLLPLGMECTLTWMVAEAERWISEHSTSETSREHIDVAWGYQVVTVHDDGQISTEVVITCRGRARKR